MQRRRSLAHDYELPGTAAATLTCSVVNKTLALVRTPGSGSCSGGECPNTCRSSDILRSTAFGRKLSVSNRVN